MVHDRILQRDFFDNLFEEDNLHRDADVRGQVFLVYELGSERGASKALDVPRYYVWFDWQHPGKRGRWLLADSVSVTSLTQPYNFVYCTV